jgi:hypothetical protein
MHLLISGQMNRHGKTVASMFQILCISDLSHPPFHARVISAPCGYAIADSFDKDAPGYTPDGFKTIGEAMEWCYEFVDY